MCASRNSTSSSQSSMKRRNPVVANNGSEAALINRTSMELEGDREIVITRTFNGPARIVFDAWTNPELVRRWWAPASLGVSMISCDADVRAGGNYRYVLQLRTGNQFAFRSEEHTSELQSQSNLVCRLLLEKKNQKIIK